jgi:hypothetical protein
MTSRASTLATALLMALGTGAAQANPYPTEAVADYLFACTAANGQTRDAVQSCSCSIDVIASILPYDAYERAETVLSMRQVRGGGEKMAMFRESAFAREAVDGLKRAQIEAELRCF